MKVAIIYNEDLSGVINQFGMQNKEKYNPKTVKRVADALEKGGHNVRVIDGNMQVVESLQEFMPRVIEGEKMGMVFNMAYGIQGESRYTHLPSMLEMLGIPYVGSGPTGHAMALDKVITKIIMQKQDISTPDFWVFSKSDEDMEHVRFPVIVKPKMEAVSYGLKVVFNTEELRDAVAFITQEFKQQALVEQFIRGREFCVGLLGNDNLEAFPILEIDLGKDPDAIQSVDDKKYQPRGKICPADLSREKAKEMIKLSKDAFRALELRDFARVDIRLDENENIYLLEINSMASLGTTGSYVHAANVAGYDYTRLVNKMLDVAAVRYFSESVLHKPKEETKGDKKTKFPVRVRGFLRSRQQKIERLLKDMVNINTHYRNIDGVNAMGNLLWRELSALGFNQQIIPQVEVGNILLFSNVPTRNYDVLLLGNLDTSVPFKQQQHFRLTVHRLYGSGVWSNKSGLALMIAALQALRFSRILNKVRLGILLTSDFSIQGRYARDHINEVARKSKVVIGLKGGGVDSTVVTSRSGAAVYSCQMNLEHAEKTADVAKAVAAFSQLMTRCVQITNESKGIIVAPSEVEIKSNIAELHARGEALLSVRFNAPEQINEVEDQIQQLVKKANKGEQAILIEGGIRRPSMLFTEKNDQIWQRLKKIADDLDVRLIKEHRWSSSDIAFVDEDLPRIDGLGPIGFESHSNDEYILRHSLLERAAFLTVLLNDLAKEPIK